MEPGDLHPSPLAQFARWFDEARQAGIREPEAAALATADASGRPSARMVLLRGFGQDGFRFFSNHESRKGTDLAANPWAALLFYWEALERQVRIEGRVSRLPGEESDAYFATRPRESRLGAWASAQSRPLAGREALVRAVEDASLRFPGEVPRPPWWGGFLLDPDRFEFWVAGAFRLHDRFLYEPGPDGWTRTRLSP
jgi:pyridoxamine 5'-phosphate oxidase